MRYFGNNIRLFVNNLVVGYTDNGQENAPVIIFIHSFMLNKNMWNSQLNALKEKYRVISYDIRGHGDSEQGTDDFSIDLFVNDLIHLMNTLKVEKASLCGLSIISLNAIKNHPERFEALVLNDRNYIDNTTAIKQNGIDTIESIREFGVEKYVDECIEQLFAPESYIAKEDVISGIKDMIINMSEQSLSKILALSVHKPTYNKLPEIKIPVFFIVGEKDKITCAKETILILAKIQDSSLYIVAHAGYLSNLEQPEEFNQQLKVFFSRIYYEPVMKRSRVFSSFLQRSISKLNSLYYSFSKRKRLVSKPEVFAISL